MQQLGKSCGNYLTEKANDNHHIWVLDGDLADSDGAEIFAYTHPERFVAAGIAEQNMISMAAGLATTYKNPWVFSFAAFLCYRAYDQIRTCVSQTNIPVALVGSHAGACGGRNGKTHITLNDIALMTTLPNINVFAPADTQDTHFVIDQYFSNPAPLYLRLPRDPLSELPGKSQAIRWLGNPTKVALVSYGHATHWALKIQNLLKQNGIDIGIIHVCQIWPLTQDMLKNYFTDVEHIFVIEDHYSLGGLASCLYEKNLKCKIDIFSWPNNWSGQSGSTSDLLQLHQVSQISAQEKIEKTFRKIMN